MKYLVFLLALFALAKTAAADAPRWPAATFSGSDRLLAYSLTSGPVPEHALGFLRDTQRRYGFTHPEGAGPQYLGGGLRLAPVLDYDSNVNGGIPGETLDAGPLSFTIDEDSRARASWVAGVALSGHASWSLAPRHVLTLSGVTRHWQALEQDDRGTDSHVQACLTAASASWVWVDSCIGARHQEKGTEIRERFATVGGTVMASSALADHAITVRLRRGVREDYVKDSLTLGVLSAVPGLGALGLEAEFGTLVEGHDTTVRRYALSLARPVAGKRMALRAGLSQTDGAEVFGLSRQDDTYSLSVSRDLREGLSLTVGYRVTRSSIGAFDSQSPFVGIGWEGLRF